MKGKYQIIKNLNRFFATGDTIFVGGCGRFFEGNAEQMLDAFNLARTLPEDTLMLPGHEYTMSNMAFCAKAEGRTNKKIGEYAQKFQSRLNSGRPTIPTSLREEKEFNVFMRTTDPVLQQALGESDPVECMHILR
jgi:hydroxyacylglutathione hydrolase